MRVVNSARTRMTAWNMRGTGRRQILVALGWIFLFVTQSGAGEARPSSVCVDAVYQHQWRQFGKTSAISPDADALISQICPFQTGVLHASFFCSKILFVYCHKSLL